MTRTPSLRQTAQLLQSTGGCNLEQRLGLYQVFLRLYESNRALLDEILDLENLEHPEVAQALSRYVIGCRDGGVAYLMTNLAAPRSRSLYQSEQTWIVGRAKDAGICLNDPRLSRYHAAIRYSPEQGFVLMDLQSTNGSFVNGEAVRYCQVLKEGDRIRLGSSTIQFFEQPEAQRLPNIPAEACQKLADAKGSIPSSPARAGDMSQSLGGDETMAFLAGEQQEPLQQQTALLERLRSIH